MLMNAGNKNFPSQSHFMYGHQNEDKHDDDSFSDEDGERDDEDDDGSDYGEGELNSAQKKKLK